MEPDVRITAGCQTYGLAWKDNRVHVYYHVPHASDSATWGEWAHLTSAVLPAEVACVISGYCANKLAQAQLPNDRGWRAIGIGSEERRI